MLVIVQIEYIGGIWGFHTHIAMWLNANPTKAEAVLYFANVALAIPTGKFFCPLPEKSCTECVLQQSKHRVCPPAEQMPTPCCFPVTL